VTTGLIDSVAGYLGYTQDEVLALGRRAPVTYRHYKIPKKKHGFRTIHHPSKQTKALQYALIEIFLSRLPIHKCAVAYRRGLRAPLRLNATIHAKYRYSVKVDFSDFFHHISPEDLLSQVQLNQIELSPEEVTFVSNCLFVRLAGGRMGLAIGAPSSPIVSNIVMYSIDEATTSLAGTISDQAAYTRYADDIIFSTDLRHACQTFYKALNRLVSETRTPRLVINEEKTVFASRASRRVVTGLFLRPDAGISLGRENKRYIRKLLFDLSRGCLGPELQGYLSGYLAFALDVEPDFYNRLALKYGAELLDRALNRA